ALARGGPDPGCEAEPGADGLSDRTPGRDGAALGAGVCVAGAAHAAAPPRRPRCGSHGERTTRRSGGADAGRGAPVREAMCARGVDPLDLRAGSPRAQRRGDRPAPRPACLKERQMGVSMLFSRSRRKSALLQIITWGKTVWPRT